MPKKWTAFRNKLDEPLQWVHREGHLAVFHRVEIVGPVVTPEGEMMAVKIRNKVDLSNPDTDIIVLVGQAKQLRASGKINPQSPELWYWDDRFWLKAVDSTSNIYYNQKCYLLYEVKVENETDLLGGLKHHWQSTSED